MPRIKLKFFNAAIGSLTLFLAFSMSKAQAATIDSISNIAKTHDQEAWIISYSGRQASKPQLNYYSNKKLLQVKFPRDTLAKNLKYPYRIGNSIFNRIDYTVTKREVVINFYLNAEASSQIVKDGNSWKLIVSYNSTSNIPPIIVAIDAGHGGKDPGTIGRFYRLYEKNVTYDISKRLYTLLNADPNFTPVLTRSKDIYIPVPLRSEIARSKKANLLISIHADASPNTRALGASVWVLSTTRATTETGRLLERQEQQSTLLGGTGEVLTKNRQIARDVIDLSYTQQQQVSTLLAQSILQQMSQITNLHKTVPQYASLGVLKSPDIPSILIETGFLSNKVEEGRLRTTTYRQDIAQAIYNGLINFRAANLARYISHSNVPEVTMREDRTSTGSRKFSTARSDGNAATIIVGTTTYIVKAGDTLYRIADAHDVSYSQLREVNPKIKETIYVGQKLNLPVVQSAALPEIADKVDYTRTSKYSVKPGDSLNRIALNHKLSLDDLLKANPKIDKDKALHVGWSLNIPSGSIAADDDDSYETVTKLVDSGERYKVLPGDNITLIAKRYAIEVDDLASFNQKQPNRIFAGETLKIPQIVVTKQKTTQSKDVELEYNSTPKVFTKPEIKQDTNKNNSTSNDKESNKQTSQAVDVEPVLTTHVVKSGDFLGSIARKYSMSLASLRELNNLKNDNIYIGQKLKVHDQEATQAALAAAKAAQEQAAKVTQEKAKQDKTPLLIDHIVVAGDNLSSIAQTYQMTLTQLQELNNFKRKTLWVGQKVKVFAPKETTSQNRKSSSNAQEKKSQARESKARSLTTYTVVAGDTLSGIAAKFNMTLKELMELNKLKSRTAFKGQKLKVYRK